MPLIDKSNEEKKRFIEWAAKYGEKDNFLTYQRDKDIDSYFIDFNNEDNCVEYGFSNVPQLQQQLSRMWTHDAALMETIRLCAISGFKGKPKNKEDTFATENATHGNTVTIPDFVYAF